MLIITDFSIRDKLYCNTIHPTSSSFSSNGSKVKTDPKEPAIHIEIEQ